MSVKPIIANVEVDKNRITPPKINSQIYIPALKNPQQGGDKVSFQGGINPVVGLMDVIDAGGYAAAFIIQDGLGFIAPRVGKGILRGGEIKTDKQGNPILDENGEPKHKLNWQYARKEAIREIVTGPSAFLIPMVLLKGIKKWAGESNNIKLNYIEKFSESFGKYTMDNFEEIKKGKLDRTKFYTNVYDVILKENISEFPGAITLTAKDRLQLAIKLAKKQVNIEEILTDTTLTKDKKKEQLELLGTVEEDYMALRKKYIGGVVDEVGLTMRSADGSIKNGNITELKNALADYYSDAIKSTKKMLADGLNPEKLMEQVKDFSKHRMSSRIITNLGLFGAVAAFYTQIPKLYNWGLKGNPALGNDVNEANNTSTKNPTTEKKQVSFTGGLSDAMGKLGSKVFSNKTAKSISDLFEFNGNIISGSAMPVLLYGFCIPPRLMKAQDEYDMGEIIVRDLSSFTALLFGAKALSRLFSDGFTKITGLALNKKDMENRSTFKKIFDYLNPTDGRHQVLSTAQLKSKYTNIHEYRDGVIGFIEFIEKSGGDIKKAFSADKEIMKVIDQILSESGKNYAQATSADIKAALSKAHTDKHKLMKEFYNLFKGDNGLLSRAKTSNSTFGFVSTILLIPGLIYWLTTVCEKMTANRIKKVQKQQQELNRTSDLNPIQKTPTMEGFLGRVN